MDLIEKYLGEMRRNMKGVSLDNWRKGIVHNNPYVGRFFDDRILNFRVFDENSNIDMVFIWTGTKWMNMDKIKDAGRYVYDQKDAALELMRKAIPKLKKQTNMQKHLEFMKGW